MWITQSLDGPIENHPSNFKPFLKSFNSKFISSPQIISEVGNKDGGDSGNNSFRMCENPFAFKGNGRIMSRDYKLKIKTELCKSWVKTKSCPYGDTCAFAHGEHELQKKKHVPSRYKTKLCQQFHENQYCPYGVRCQFIHSQKLCQLLQSKDDNGRLDVKKLLSYRQILKENIECLKQRLIFSQNPFLNEFNLIYKDIVKRLEIFERITTIGNVTTDDNNQVGAAIADKSSGSGTGRNDSSEMTQNEIGENEYEDEEFMAQYLQQYKHSDYDYDSYNNFNDYSLIERPYYSPSRSTHHPGPDHSNQYYSYSDHNQSATSYQAHHKKPSWRQTCPRYPSNNNSYQTQSYSFGQPYVPVEYKNHGPYEHSYLAQEADYHQGNQSYSRYQNKHGAYSTFGAEKSQYGSRYAGAKRVQGYDRYAAESISQESFQHDYHQSSNGYPQHRHGYSSYHRKHTQPCNQSYNHGHHQLSSNGSQQSHHQQKWVKQSQKEQKTYVYQQKTTSGTQGNGRYSGNNTNNGPNGQYGASYRYAKNDSQRDSKN